VAYRYTAYQLDDNYQNYNYYGLQNPGQVSPFTQQDPTRALPIVSVDSGLVFDRSTSLFGQDYTQTLEPRLYYLYVPYRNQDNLPLFDTSLMTFDYWQLFSTNQFSSADRQMNANNLTAAVTTRLLDDGGVERLSASFGQIRYFTPQQVQMPNGATTTSPATDWAGSSYVAQLDLQLNDRWRFSSSYQWSPNTRQTDMAMFQMQGRLGLDGVVNFTYIYRQGLLEQYSTSAVYPLSESWRLIGGWTYAVPVKGVTSPLHGTVEALAGVEYDSCCVTLRLVDRNYVNQGYYGFGPIPTGNSNYRDNAIMFEVVFKGLGSTGGQIDPLLRRDILGYQ
jgi:LPS-assembly protein